MRIYLFFLYTFIAILCVNFYSSPVNAAEINGSWGTVPWVFKSDTGELTFLSGGNLGSYSSSPWNSPNGITITSVKKIRFTGETFAPEDSTYLFSSGNSSNGLSNLSVVEGFSYLNTSKVTNMTYMFNFFGATTLDLSNFDTSNVTTMRAMFANARKVTSLDLSSFNTSKVTSMQGMFFHTYGLEKLNLSSFDTSKVNDFYNMFADDTNLKSLTLGSKVKLSNSTNLPPIGTNLGEYTGKWIGVSSNATGHIYSSSSTFMQDYDSGYSGTYVWQTLRTLEVKDSIVSTTDSWSAENNFVSATDVSGNAVPFSNVTVSGSVDTKKAGTYEVIYSYGPLIKIAKIKVEDVAAKIKVEFVQGTNILSDYTLNITGYKVWDTVDLKNIDSITQQISHLNSLGYIVNPPDTTITTLSLIDNKVQYTVTGMLRLLVPRSITFPSVAYTGEDQTLTGSVNGSLIVQDTLGASDNKGWSLQVAVSKPLTDINTGTVETGATFSYIGNDNTNITLSGANQIISTSSSGSGIISDSWGISNDSPGVKLTMDKSVGVGNYSGKLTWTLQAGPES